MEFNERPNESNKTQCPTRVVQSHVPISKYTGRHRFGRIQQPVLNRAVDYALKHQSQLTVVDSVPDLQWTQKLVLSGEAEHFPELLAREKSKGLKKLVSSIRRRGLKAKHRVLMGRSSLEITKQVLQNKHDLVMKAAKGRHSRQSGFLGTTAKGLLRNCPCTVWLLKPEHHGAFQHAMAAVDTSPDDSIMPSLTSASCNLRLDIAPMKRYPWMSSRPAALSEDLCLGNYALTDEFRSMLASIGAGEPTELECADLRGSRACLPKTSICWRGRRERRSTGLSVAKPRRFVGAGNSRPTRDFRLFPRQHGGSRSGRSSMLGDGGRACWIVSPVKTQSPRGMLPH